MSGNSVHRRTDRRRFELLKEFKNSPLVVLNVILRVERYSIKKNLRKTVRANGWNINRLRMSKRFLRGLERSSGSLFSVLKDPGKVKMCPSQLVLNWMTV